MTLLERMQEVLDTHQWSGREWARRAGLAEESHVNGLMRALRNSERDRVGDVDTWARLAKAAGVSLDWLVLGRGTPQAMQIEILDDPVFPSRPRVLAVAHWIGFTEAAISAVAAHIPSGSGDPGPEYWLRLLQAEQSRHPALPGERAK